jgi:hypothetical protein
MMPLHRDLVNFAAAGMNSNALPRVAGNDRRFRGVWIGIHARVKLFRNDFLTFSFGSVRNLNITDSPGAARPAFWSVFSPLGEDLLTSRYSTLKAPWD